MKSQQFWQRQKKVFAFILSWVTIEDITMSGIFLRLWGLKINFTIRNLKLFYFCVCVAFILFCLFNLKEKSFETSHFPQTWGYPIKLANRGKKNKKENHWRTSEICFWLYRCNQDMNDRFHCTPFQWHFECVISFGSGGSKLRYVWKIFVRVEKGGTFLSIT